MTTNLKVRKSNSAYVITFSQFFSQFGIFNASKRKYRVKANLDSHYIVIIAFSKQTNKQTDNNRV